MIYIDVTFSILYNLTQGVNVLKYLFSLIHAG